MITLSDITKANLPKLELDFLIRSPNIAKDLPKDVCDAIGMAVVEGFDRDLSSRGVGRAECPGDEAGPAGS